MNPSFPEKYNRVHAGVLALMFAILVWLPTLDTFLHLDKAPASNENRSMVKFPKFQAYPENLRGYVADVERYFNDHFGFRNRLIRSRHALEHRFFKATLSDEVIIGRDGWLFFTGEHMNMIDYVHGVNLFTPDQLKAWQKLLESRRDWCVRHGSDYIFVIASDKQSIYPEYLPDWLLPVKHPNKLDQFIGYMKTNSTVPVLDLRTALLNAKTNEILYLLSDTHWNDFGAFVGYQSLIKTLSQQLPDLKPLPLDNFERKLVQAQGGDLARMIGQQELMVEAANMVFSPVLPLKPLSNITDDKLLVKMGAKYFKPIFTENAGAKGKVVMFRDSFASYWIPFLGYNFNKVYYVWEYHWDMNFLKQQKPDVVIDEMVERNFASTDPAGLKENN